MCYCIIILSPLYIHIEIVFKPMTRTTKHNSLNAKQLQILALLYKFRYTTTLHLAAYKNIRQDSLHKTLNILVQQNYIERKYDNSFKIDRKPAIYYLSKKGIAELKQDERFDADVLHAFYKNSTLSDAFIQHSLDTMAICNTLRALHPDVFHIYTKQELHGNDAFPETKPDLYMKPVSQDASGFLLYLLEDARTFIVKKRLQEILEHYEEEGWGSDVYPSLLFVLANAATEKRVARLMSELLENAGIDEITFYTTTLNAMQKPFVASAVWTKMDGSLNTNIASESVFK
jgi:DNA-binding MarR family transcriptional regulator